MPAGRQPPGVEQALPGVEPRLSGDRSDLPAGLRDELRAAWLVRQAGFPPEIRFVRPGATLPISLTGQRCDLGCAHCGGHYLRHMASLDEALAGRTARSRRAASYLVSGGCMGAGTVPFMPFLSQLQRLKARGRLNFHVGLVGEDEAAALAGLADTVSFDLIADDDTIRDVLGLSATAEDYRSALRRLRRHAPVVPHILVGLHGGVLKGELRAVEVAACEGCERVVFIVFIPTPGTRFAACRPPDARTVAGFLARARLLLPAAELGLGCMRPGGAYRRLLDPLAIRAGVQRVVQPSAAAIIAAEALGLKAVWSEECCVL